SVFSSLPNLEIDFSDATSYTSVAESAAIKAVSASTSINGSAAVGNDGSSGYQMPIYTPQGINSLSPSLSVIYNSRGGRGLVGAGWGLSGLSVITRCGQTPEHGDGVFTQVSFTNRDRLCLDGARLVSADS